MTVWFITGASRGFGRELTGAALAAGHQVVATARDPRAVAEAFPDAGESLLPVRLDVTDAAQARAAVAAALDAFGRIDVLVNNAGYGLFGAVEEVSDAEIRDLFDTNVFGLLTVTRDVLPSMRAQRSGRILNLSSVAGIDSRAGVGVYAASKYAVEALTEALAGELAPHGVHATAIEPGAFRTDFLTAESVRRAADPIDAYADTAHVRSDALKTANGRQPGDPAKLVAALLKVAASENPPVHLPLGRDCVARLEDKQVFVRKELDEWRELAVSTDIDE